MMEGPGANSEEKHEPASYIDTALVDSLKALDPEGPIREADMPANGSFAPEAAVLFRSSAMIANAGWIPNSKPQRCNSPINCHAAFLLRPQMQFTEA